MDSSLNSTTCYAVGVTSAGMASITADDVMRWAYLGLAIVSLLIPLVVKVVDIFKNKKLTKEAAEELQAELEKAKEAALKQLQAEHYKDKDNK